MEPSPRLVMTFSILVISLSRVLSELDIFNFRFPSQPTVSRRLAQPFKKG